MKRISLYFMLLVLSLGIGAQAKNVTVVEAGTLSTQVSNEEVLTLKELTISGPLNGDDILLLKQMSANLETLNISNASIVEGGSSYGNGNFTSNNVIGDKMFYSMTALKTVVLPNTVTSIGTPISSYGANEAFGRCVSLESVTFPSSLLYIGNRAFSYCRRLTSITIPEGVEALGQYAFENCAGLVSVSLPKTLGIPNKLEFFKQYKHFVNWNNSWVDGEYVYDKPQYGNIQELYGHTFFGCEKLSKVTMAEGLEALPPYMFKNCQALTSVTLPSSMKALNSAFQQTPISSINLPAGLIQVGSFQECTKLTSLIIPDGAGYIFGGAFNGCIALTSITLPKELTTLPSEGFNGCTLLNDVILPEGLTNISSSVFNECTSLSSITIPNKVTTINSRAFSGCTELTDVKLPEELTTIGEYAFQRCIKLNKIELPSKISSIGYQAFQNCASLKSVNLPLSIVEIDYGAFEGCTSLEDIEIPASLITISSSTFGGCSALKSVKLPTLGLTNIDNNAFNGCSSLKEIEIPGNVEKIASQSFASCGLEKVTLKMGILTVGDGAFSECQKLKEVIFPESMTTINGFNNTGIKNITFPKSATAIGAGAFQDCDSLRTLAIPEGIETINYDAFYDCDSLTVVTLPTTLKKLHYGVFYSTNIKEITIPEGVTEIEYNTFAHCRILSSVKLPESLGKISNMNNSSSRGAFSYCPRLKSITFPARLVEIQAYTFNQSGLIDINIPATVLIIGNGAFNCEYSEYIDGTYVYHELNSVVWNSTNEFPTSAFSNMTYLYLPEGTIVSDVNIAKYIFRDGITDAMKIEATNGRFSISKELKAKQVTYSKRFTTQSGYNEAAGWRTIVLPFSVDKFAYTGNNWDDTGTENLPLAPFGSDVLTTDESARPFWLYELTVGGTYQAATKLEANKPYLICMPNNNAYPTSSNISGWVRFSAKNEAGITLGVTEGALQPAEGTTFSLVPTYETRTKSEQVYALNESSSYGEYPTGSVFIRNYADVEPFQAYLQTKEAANRAPMLYSIGGGGGNITGLGDMILTPDKAVKVRSANGIIYIESNAAHIIRIYDVSGRTVHTLEAQEGNNEVKGLSDGIYFLEGQKVMVRK